MTQLRTLQNIIHRQFCLFRTSRRFDNHSISFCWDEAREFCSVNKLDTVDFVDACVDVLKFYYIEYTKEHHKHKMNMYQSITNSEFAHNKGVITEWAENAWYTEYLVHKDIFLYELLLQTTEPEFLRSLSESESVYYTLTYLG